MDDALLLMRIASLNSAYAGTIDADRLEAWPDFFTDDAFPIATTAGSLSLVIPDFASRPFALPECAVYRLSATGKWEKLSAWDVISLIQLQY